MRLSTRLEGVLFLLSVASSAWAASGPADDWNARTALPRLMVPRKPDPDAIYRASPPPAAAETFATDAEAEKAAREVLLKRFGKPSATLEVERIARPAQGYLVRFRGLFHGILIHSGGAEVAFTGKTPSGAWQLITNFVVQPKSEKKIVSKAAALKALEQWAAKKGGQATSAEQKAEWSQLRLVYTFSPDNLKAAGDRKDDVYVPVWGTEHGPLIVDAWSGLVISRE